MSKTLFSTAASLFMAASCFAAPVSLNLGQSVKLYNGANGKSLTVTHTGNNNRLIFSASDKDFEGMGNGMVTFLNVIHATVAGGPTASVQEQYYTDEFEDRIRVGIRVISPGSSITLDDQTGALLSVAGSSMGTISTTYRPTIGGGSITTNNLRISLETKTVFADVQGLSLPLGSKPAIATNLSGAPIWTYDSVTGPTTIPVHELTTSTNIQEALTKAGFKIWSVAPDRITANAILTFSGVRMNEQLQRAFSTSLGTTNSYYANALASTNRYPAGMGQLTVSVMFSIPVPVR